MDIESVKLLRTLKAGENVWVEGTVFPNDNCPYIPKEIIGEAALGRKTVEILSERPEGGVVVSKPIFKNESDGETNTTLNAQTSLRNREIDQSPKEKSGKTARSTPKKRKSLAKRKK